MAQNERFNILINKDSGTVRRLGMEGVETIISASPINLKSLIFVSSDEIESRFEQLMAQDYPILLGGGDGTIAHAVSYFQPAQKPFGILPMGTMNLMAGDLGIPAKLEEALAQYAKGTRVITVDMGEVNGRPFLCCAALGVMPEASKFRENNRGSPDAILMPRLTLFILEQLKRTHHRKIRTVLDGVKKRFRTAALIISNNQYAQENKNTGAAAVAKEKLNSGLLGIYNILPRNLWERLLLLFRLRIGGWKSDPF
nr:diacylglycerol kinase family protein [Alphaproteobacteria bacterium]